MALYKRAVCAVVVVVVAASLVHAAGPPGAETLVGPDTSVLLSWRNQGKLWDDIAGSRFWAKFRALPGILMLRVQINQALGQNPQYQAFMAEHGDDVAFLKGLLRDEVTVTVPDASVVDVAKLVGAVAETGLMHGQIASLGAQGDPQVRDGLQKQAVKAWKRVLECKIPSLPILIQCNDPEALARLKRLFALIQLPPVEGPGPVIGFESTQHAGVQVEMVSFGLNEMAAVELVSGLDLARSLPADAAQDIGEALIDKLTERISLSYAVSGGYCLACLGGDRKALTDLIDRQKNPVGPSLAASEHFKPLLSWMDGEVVSLFVDLTSWGDVYANNISPVLVPLMELLERVDPQGEQTNPAREAITFADKLLVTLPQAMQYSGAVTVRDRGLLSRAFAKVDPEKAKEVNQVLRDARFGHASAFELVNKAPQVLKIMPADLIGMAIDVNIDPAAQWANVTRSFLQQRPMLEQAPEGRKSLALVDRYNELVMEKVLPKLGRETGFVLSSGGTLSVGEQFQEIPVPALTIAVEAKDGPGLVAAVQEVIGQANADLAAEQVPFVVKVLDAEAYKGVNIQKYAFDLAEVAQLTGEGLQPCTAVVGNVFIMATSPDPVRRMVDAAGGGPSLASNPRFRALKDVYRPTLMTMSFGDLEGSFDWLKVLAQFVFAQIEKQVQAPDAGQAQLGVAMILASVKTTVLQGLDCLKVLKCGGTCVWADGDMIFSRGRLIVEDLPPPAAP